MYHPPCFVIKITINQLWVEERLDFLKRTYILPMHGPPQAMIPLLGSTKKGRYLAVGARACSKLSATNEEHSKQGLQGCWADINKKVTKFNGTYLQIKRVPWSGYNEEKYVEDALALFLEEEGESFSFLSCWQYLKEKPKWLGNRAPKKKEPKKAAVKQEQKLP